MSSFHKFKKTIMGTVVIALIATSMLGFGVDLGGKSQKRDNYAIRIDDVTIPHDEFYSERRRVEQQYRMMFGKEYQRFIEQAKLDLNQQVADSLITKALVMRTAADMGIAGSREEAARKIVRELFPNGYDQNTYRAFLSQQRTTAAQFEHQVAQDLVREQFLGVLEDLSEPSTTELRAEAERRLKKLDVTRISIDPKRLLEMTSEPTQEELEKYYQTHSAEFEQPLQVQYEYSVLEMKSFPDLVKVSNEDIELYYTDNQSKFRNPEVKARHIQFSFPKDATPEQKEAVKKSAEELIAKLKQGEDFAELAKLYSDDFDTKEKGGDLGWFARGKMKSELEDAAFKNRTAGEAVLVPAPYGYHVVKVEGYNPGNMRPLSEVRTQIEQELKKEEGPAFLSAKATELFQAWEKDGGSLSDFGKKNNLSVATTNGFLSEKQDPEPQLKGLTGKVLSSPDVKKQLIELGSSFLLVSIQDIKEPEIPSLESSRSKVLEKFRTEQGTTLTKSAVDAILKKLADRKTDSLKSASSEYLPEVKEIKAVSQEEPGDLGASPALDEVFQVSSPTYLPKSFQEDGKQVLYQVTAIIPPSDSEISSEASELRSIVKNESNRSLTESLVAQLRANSETDIDAGILAAQ